MWPEFIQNLQDNDLFLTLLVFFGVILLVFLFSRYIFSSIENLASKTSTNFDDKLISKLKTIGWPFYLFLDIFITLRFLETRGSDLIPGFYSIVLDSLSVIILAFYFSGIINIVGLYLIRKQIDKANQKGARIDTSVTNILDIFLKILIWSLGLIFSLQTLGIDVTALITGLGVGGIAFAFALQNILGDVFASIAIYLDKPFVSGQVVQFGNTVGKVKKIGIKSTRIETLNGEEYIISNKLLTDGDLKNFAQMDKRRELATLGVVYETSKEQLRKIPEIIKEIVNELDLAELERVNFTSFGDFSLNFELVYYVLTPDYNTFMNIKEKINLEIFDRFAAAGIEFAYPTQTLLLQKNQQAQITK